MRTRILILLIAVFFGSAMAHAKGRPNQVASLGAPSAERCTEVARVAERLSSRPESLPGRPSRGLLRDSMRCAAAEKAAEQKSKRGLLR